MKDLDHYTPDRITHEPTFTMDEYRLALSHSAICTHAGETFEQSRVRCALETARALHAFNADIDACVEWEQSEFEWDGDVPYDGPLFDAVLYIDTAGQPWPQYRPASSLGCIAVPDTDDPYCRIVEAELYDEARS